MTIRPPAVAGSFYPQEKSQLHTMLTDMLNESDVTPQRLVPKAIIAPHASYIYSGPIAATIYNQVKPARETITRVVLLGPSHHVAFRGVATCSSDAYRTPLGDIEIDRTAIETVSALPQVNQFDAAHAQEHSLEVQLPFLQEVLNPSFKLVPLVVGDATPTEVAEVLETLWGGDETLIVISSDLSHFHDYEQASARDAATTKTIEALNPDVIEGGDACGCRPVNGLLAIARAKGLSVETLDLRNSGDTAGPRDRVVGYGAYSFIPSESGQH